MKACMHGVVAGQCNDCLAQTLETEAAMLAKILEPDREHDPAPAFTRTSRNLMTTALVRHRKSEPREKFP
jgi:hypothetical protein